MPRLRLLGPAASLVLVLDVDPDRRRRAMVHGGGHALAYLGALPEPLRDAVRQLGAALAALGPGSTAATVSALIAEAQRRGLALELLPALPTLPTWPAWLRTGAPPLTGPLDLWPFDAELTALEHGLRAAIKRECFSDAEQHDDEAWLAGHGLATAQVGAIGPDGRRTVLAAPTAAALTALTTAELAVQAGLAPEAARTLGAALGYPPCCVEAFVATAGHDDDSLAAARLGVDEVKPASALTVWINQPLALVSHVPCTVHCARTAAQGAVVLRALDAAHPGFAAAWRALASRVHAIDHDGVGWAVRGATTDDALIVDDAVGFAVPPAEARVVARAHPQRRGAQLRRADVALWVDHRGDSDAVP